jgi:calcium channel MID1
MQLPKLKPLQSRLLASALTTCLVIALCAGFEPHNLVYAAEAPVQSGGDSNLVESIPLALPDVPVIERRGNEAEERSDGVYATDFAYFDRSVVGRQQEEVKQLADNQKEEASAAPNSTQFYRFKPDQPKSNSARAVLDDALEENNTLERILIKEEDADTNDGETVIEKRQNSRRVWISANACSGPLPNVTLITGETPQLTLYVSTSANNQKPGPRTPDTTAVPFVQGFANLTLQTGNEIYMGVSAPDLTAGWNGGWSYEIAASVEGQYHNYANNSQFIYMVDTDSESALFITHNFTDSNSADEVKKWTDQNRFDMYAFPAANWSNMKGLEASYCGLKKQFDAGGITVNKSITTIFGNGLPAGQFHIAGLKNSTKYTGFLTLAGSESETMDIPDIGTVRAGGQVFQQFQWTTKAGMSLLLPSHPHSSLPY